MKQDYATVASITTRALSMADWGAYRDFYKSLKTPHHFKGFLEDVDLDDPKTYEALFQYFTRPFVLIGLWDKDKLIGQTSISFIDKGRTAYFAGSEILDDYRGLKLVDKLYEVRTEYLRRIGFNGPVMMTINPENESSHKAATRNGFVKTGEQDGHGYDILVPKGMM